VDSIKDGKQTQANEQTNNSQAAWSIRTAIRQIHWGGGQLLVRVKYRARGEISVMMMMMTTTTMDGDL